MSLAIDIKDLVKEYDLGEGKKYLALESLNLEVPKGCIFGLLGPNGAGKSTLINILAGSVVKTSGSVSIAGVSLENQPKKTSMQIGIVPQEISLDSFFPLYQGLEFYAGYYGIRPKDRKTEKILKDLSLWDKRDKRPIQLSGGMKRRFLIAKALVHSPKVLILDEPTAGVDLDLRNHLWSLIRRLKKEGVTIIITTHYLAEAQELCDEIAFINHGKIIKQASKTSLLSELGTRYIEVDFMEPIKSELFNSQECKIIDGNRVRFSIDQDNSYNDILKSIAKFSMDVKNLEVVQPDLEDVFYKIMQSDRK
ncbi:MAG: hypothetical protein DGJ47_000593 [Rickettsiaceae bacterium]